MNVIQDERADQATIDKCEECERTGVKGRRIEVFGAFQESRGFYNICFDCMKPRIIWKKDGRIITTPID